MEDITALYMIKSWDKDWLSKGQHRFRHRFSCESQEITVYPDTADPCIMEVGYTLI
jgi:hypothetical protein